MKTAEEAVKILLESHSGLAGLIGTRSYMQLLPQTPLYPCAVYSRTSTPQRMSQFGADSDIVRPVMSVQAYSLINAEVYAVSAQIINCLRRYRGIVGTVEILDIYLLNEVYLYDNTARVYYSTLDFEIVHRE